MQPSGMLRASSTTCQPGGFAAVSKYIVHRVGRGVKERAGWNLERIYQNLLKLELDNDI